MDLKSALNGYFEETTFPSELFPDKIAKGLKPRTQPKKTVETQEEPPKPKSAGTSTMDVTVPIPKLDASPAPAPAPKPEAKPAAKPEPNTAGLPKPQTKSVPKTEPSSLPVQKPAPVTAPPAPVAASPAPAPVTAPPAPKPETQSETKSQTKFHTKSLAKSEAKPAMNASALIKVVRYHHLTGSEFLSLLGNSKISNKAYQEIETNPKLTVKRLIEILEESPLTSADYEKLIIAVQRASKLKEEAKVKLGEAKPAPAPEPKPAPALEPKPAPEPKSVPTLTPSPIQEEPKLAETRDSGETAEELREEPAPGNVPMPMLFDEGENLDGSFDDPEEEKKESGSNKVKFIVSAAAAVFLILLSFGLRWYLTGSLLPGTEVQAEELKLDEAGIFDVLSALPSPGAPAFAENRSYTPGGRTVDSVLRTSLTTNNRLLYVTDNTLYIFEKLGGQLEQLDARKYGEDTQILGLLKLNGGIAVVTSFEGTAYEFTYTVPPETEEDIERTLSSTVQRPETVIELLEAEKPENRGSISVFGFSGSLVQLWAEGDRILAVTSESIPEGAAAQAPLSFMPYSFSPYIDVSDNRMPCSAENVLVPDDTRYSGFVSVFSLNTGSGACSGAAVAGGSGQLVSRSGSDLFIGQNRLLVRYDVSSGVTENGFCALSGTVGAFSAVGTAQEEVRVTVTQEGSAALIVLDNELNILSEVLNLGNGEAPLATCYSGRETYLVTESGTLFGINGENEPMTSSSTTITDAVMYRWSDTVGVKVGPMGDPDRRTGLLVTAVALDGSLTEMSTLEISSRTVAEQALDEYLSSPAETDITLMGASPEDGILVIPVVYFDGISEVERFIICNLTQQGNLSFGGSICEYDRHSSPIFALAEGGSVIAVTGDRLVTAKAADAAIIGYFSSTPPSGTYSFPG